MKLLKELSLAISGSLALVAVLAVSSASGTVLCANESSPCTSPYGVGTEIKESLVPGTSLLIEAGFANITCTESSIINSITNAGSSTGTVKSTHKTLAFGGCNATVTVLKKGETEWHWETLSRNATLTEIGTEVTVSLFGTSCVYGSSTAKDEGTFTGLVQPVVHDTHPFPKTSGGFLCANPANFVASYEVTSPTPMYAASS